MKEPSRLKLKGSVGPRDPAAYPGGDFELGSALFAQVSAALQRGRPAPSVFLIMEDTVERFSMRPLAGRSRPSRQRILAGLAGIEGVECVVMLGAFKFSGKGPLNGAWVASVFIEWPDNRWWTAWQPLGPQGALVGDAPQVRCAEDGSPRPGGMGGWFALSRRTGVKLRVQRGTTQVH